MLTLSVQEASGSTFSLSLSGAIAAIVSVAIFWLGQRFTRHAAQKERQRQAIEDWFRTLSKWVDDYGRADTDPDYAYYTLTNRQVIELSLARKNRHLAWWMHEMALAVMARRKETRKTWAGRSSSMRDLQRILTEAGEYLLAWHHGELRSSDFHIPYKLRLEARKAKTDVHKYAESLNLSSFVKPVRMNFRRSWAFQKLLLDPTTGMPILESLQRFLGKRFVLTAYVHSRLALTLLVLRIVPACIRLAQEKTRLRRSEARLEQIEAALNAIERHERERSDRPSS